MATHRTDTQYLNSFIAVSRKYRGMDRQTPILEPVLVDRIEQTVLCNINFESINYFREFL
jgi:hypothetical protein